MNRAVPRAARGAPAGVRGGVGPARVVQADLEIAKWAAVLTMAVDHYGKIVDPDVFLTTHAIGRLSFPLFVTIIGLRLGMRPELARRYLRRLLPWALVSQPIFVLAGRPFYQGNILFTLLLGVSAAVLAERVVHSRKAGSAAAALVLLAPLTLLVEYGPIGVVIVPMTAVLASRDPRLALWASGPLGLAANLGPAIPPLEWVDLCALGSSLVLIAGVILRPRLPRLPTHVFYAFYPGHLLALHLYDLYR